MAFNVPFVNITRNRGTGIPFIDFDHNNVAPTAPARTDPMPEPGTYGILGDTAAAEAARQRQRASSGNLTAGDAGGNNAATDNSLELAQYDEQEGLLRGLLAKSGGYLNQGLTQLDDDLIRGKNKATDQFGRAKQQFGMQREDTTRAQNNAVERNDTQARVTGNSVRSIIGRASGSGSSAYQIAAPNAVNRQAAQGAEDIQETYGTNARDLNFAEKNTEDDFNKLIQELQAQRADKEKQLRNDLGSKDQEMWGSIADIQRNREALRGGGIDAIRRAGSGSMDQYRAKGAEIDSLFEKYRTPAVARDVRTAAPTLRDYVPGATGIAQPRGAQAAAQANDFFKPKRDDEDELY